MNFWLNKPQFGALNKAVMSEKLWKVVPARQLLQLGHEFGDLRFSFQYAMFNLGHMSLKSGDVAH